MGKKISNSSSTPPFSDLEQGLNTLPPLSSNRCIYRVPKRLRCVNEKAYTPQLVSIGPLHHGQESLAAMEEHKMRFARDYLARPEVDFGLNHFMNIIKDREEELRSCYAERIEFSSDEFVRIVLIDALFIIELILRAFLGDESVGNDDSNYIFDSPYMFCDIIPDLLLLENQLPFFILDELFCVQVKVDDERFSMAMLSKIFFYGELDCERKPDYLELQSYSTIDHFVDLLIRFEVPKETTAGQGNVSATEHKTNLHQAEAEPMMSEIELLTETNLHQSGAELMMSEIELPTQTNLHPFEDVLMMNEIGLPFVGKLGQSRDELQLSSSELRDIMVGHAGPQLIVPEIELPTPTKMNQFGDEDELSSSELMVGYAGPQLMVRKIELQTAKKLHKSEAEFKLSATELPTATLLHQSGVKFKMLKGKKLFDIKFPNGVLEIPKLSISDTTELKLRNMVAFEQCHNKIKYVSDYVIFMGFLVHTCEDVELLVKYGIIKNCIGDNNRVAAMICKLGDGVFGSNEFNFAQIFDQLNSHCESCWNKNMANLKQNYFNSPWTTLSVIAASLIIILTLIQTVCSVISTING